MGRRRSYRGNRGPNAPRVLQLSDGRLLNILSIGDVAARLGRCNQTLRNWDKAGLFPEGTVFRDEHNRRWFPEPFVEYLAEALKRLKGRKQTMKGFRKALLEDYEHFGPDPLTEEDIPYE